MKNKSVLVIFLILTTFLFSGLLSGCSQSITKPTPQPTEFSSAVPSQEASYVNKPGTLPIVNDRISLTAAIPYNEYVADYEINYLTLMVEADTNIDLSFLVCRKMNILQESTS